LVLNKTVKINIKENKTLNLELSSELTGWKIFVALYYLILNPSGYIYLNKK